MRIKVFFAIIIILVVAITAWGFYFSHGNNNKTANRPLPTPIPLPSDYKKNYSNLNYVIPGKSTHEDVVKTNGKAESSSTFGNQTRLYYPTINPDYKNLVVLKNNIVAYSMEYVFSSYRGTLDQYVKNYGNPLIFYPKNPDDFNWYVFLNSGFAIESSNNDIVRIVYFIPQDKQGFIQTMAKDLDISENPPPDVGEPFYP